MLQQNLRHERPEKLEAISLQPLAQQQVRKYIAQHTSLKMTWIQNTSSNSKQHQKEIIQATLKKQLCIEVITHSNSVLYHRVTKHIKNICAAARKSSSHTFVWFYCLGGTAPSVAHTVASAETKVAYTVTTVPWRRGTSYNTWLACSTAELSEEQLSNWGMTMTMDRYTVCCHLLSSRHLPKGVRGVFNKDT